MADQVSGSGNLGSLLVTQRSGSAIGIRGAAASLAQGFAAHPNWGSVGQGVGGLSPSHLSIPVFLLIPACGLLLASRRRDLQMVRGIVIAMIALSGSFIEIAIAPAPSYAYLFIGQRSVAAVTVAIGLGSIWRSVDPKITEFGDPCLLRILAAFSIALSVVLLSSQWNAPVSSPEYQEAIETLSRGIQDDLADLDLAGPIEVSSQFGQVTMSAYTGVRLQLEREGITARDGGSWPGIELPAPNPDLKPQYTLVSPDSATTLTQLGWKTVGEYQPFSPMEQRNLRSLQGQLDVLLANQPTSGSELKPQQYRIDHLQQQILELTKGRVAVAVVRRDIPKEHAG